MPAVVGLPKCRGLLSRWVLDYLRGRPVGDSELLECDQLGLSDDLQLALYLCYETHYAALPAICVDWEWDPTLIAFRRRLEAEFVASLWTLTGSIEVTDRVDRIIRRMIDEDDGPSVSRHMERDGTLAEMAEFLIHRAAYQLKEGDPHTFAIPRLGGRCKQLLVEIQAGEYGADGPGRVMHSELFAQTMRSFGLDDRPNAYLDRQPASSLMVSNLISMFGLNRRWRGALVGHLAVFEMTSVVPMTRYSCGLERMGAPVAARRFYDVHTLADAEHELLAIEMAQSLADVEPVLARDIVFGAKCVIEIERRFAEHLLEGWRRNRTRATVAA